MKEEFNNFADRFFGKKGTLKRELEKYIWSDLFTLLSLDIVWEAFEDRDILFGLLGIVLFFLTGNISTGIGDHIIETYAPEEK